MLALLPHRGEARSEVEYVITVQNLKDGGVKLRFLSWMCHTLWCSMVVIVVHIYSEWCFLPTKGYIFFPDMFCFEEVDRYVVLETVFIKTNMI